MSGLSLPMPVGLLVGAAALVAIWRGWRLGRSRADRFIGGGLQLSAAVAFCLLLFPPDTALRLDTLTVIAPGASEAQLSSLRFTQTVLALPGAPQRGRVQPVPDLATGLRRHPAATSLRVLGPGLPPRDLPVAAGLALSLDAPPAQGLVALQADGRAPVGTQWQVSGTVAGKAATLELRDPSGAVVDTTSPRPDGRFRLSALARAGGALRFELRVLDTEGKATDHASVPVIFREGRALSMQVVAGAPDADLKYWRRWAADAGMSVAARIGLSDGVVLRDGQPGLAPDELDRADLVIVDERAWAGFGADEKAALLAAVERGLGLMLRVGGAPDATVAAEWAALGIKLHALEAPVGVTLDTALGLDAREPFTRAPVKLQGVVGAPWLTDDSGEPLAVAIDHGAGRIGVWTLLDSYRLVLLGEAGRYGGLWSKAVAVLARPAPRDALPALPQLAWVDERVVLCSLAPQAQVEAPGRESTPLLMGADGCAAFWPRVAGWHWQVSGARRWPFYVRGDADGANLRASRDRQATQSAATVAVPPANAAAQGAVPLPRWPFLLAWLALTAWVWWRERRGWGAGRAD